VKIDRETYKLSDKNYIPQATKKEKIVIGSTYTNKMNHYNGWLSRLNGNYTKTAMFTISLNGKIYEHFSPNYFSNFMENTALCENTITILVENEGWLVKDLKNENKYINYVGHIYNRKDSIVEKLWRNQKYWAPFKEKQINSAVNLVTKLCENFDIPLKTVSHNTNFDDAHNYNGILYRSNLERYYTDVSPAWDFELFKNKLEKKG
jgi:N-acetyl-anhydromuramyl-L-alanine amidase AmpD